MNSTLGAPSRARTGAGQAGVDSSAVRPITPGNAAPGSYSTIAIQNSPAGRPLLMTVVTVSCGATAEHTSPTRDDLRSGRTAPARRRPLRPGGPDGRMLVFRSTSTGAA